MSIKSRITQKSLKAIEKITETPLTLGKLMWAIRQSEEMSQVELAGKLGISKQQLCDIEHDRKAVSPGLAAIYADKLHSSKEQFVRLALQGIVDRDGLNFMVELMPSKEKLQENKWHQQG